MSKTSLIEPTSIATIRLIGGNQERSYRLPRRLHRKWSRT